jgi:hypothetical protein
VEVKIFKINFMFLNLKKTVAGANLCSAMEAETIQNAVSPKNHKSRENFLLLGILAVLSSTLFYSCGSLIGAAAPEEQRRYEQVIDVPNLSKTEIYIKANAWFVETFNSAESVIEFQDKESGKIMGKYVFQYDEGVYHYVVRQTISIDTRDNKARIVINDPYFIITSAVGQTYPNAQYQVLKTQKGIDKARIRWEKLTSELTKYLQTNDSW